MGVLFMARLKANPMMAIRDVENPAFLRAFERGDKALIRAMKSFIEAEKQRKEKQLKDINALIRDHGNCEINTKLSQAKRVVLLKDNKKLCPRCLKVIKSE